MGITTRLAMNPATPIVNCDTTSSQKYASLYVSTISCWGGERPWVLFPQTFLFAYRHYRPLTMTVDTHTHEIWQHNFWWLVNTVSLHYLPPALGIPNMVTEVGCRRWWWRRGYRLRRQISKKHWSLPKDMEALSSSSSYHLFVNDCLRLRWAARITEWGFQTPWWITKTPCQSYFGQVLRNRFQMTKDSVAATDN